MARRRSRKTRSYRRKGMSMDMKKLVGSAGYAAVGEPILDMLASKLGFGVSDEFVKGIGGWFLSKKTSGILKAVGDSAVAVSTYKLGQQFLPNVLGSLNTSSSSSKTASATQSNGYTLA